VNPSSFGFKAPPSGSSFSRLTFIVKSKMNYCMFSCAASNLHFTNCFFGSEFKTDFRSGMLNSINSSVSLEDCVMTQAARAVMLTKSKAVLRNNIIEAYGFGIDGESSQVEIENVHLRCFKCISFLDDSEVTVKKCVLQEEPHHFSQHVPPFPQQLVGATKSTLSIEDSIIGSNFCGRDKHLVDVNNSKFIMRNCELNKKDADAVGVIRLQQGANGLIENNKFGFKNQETENLSLVLMDKTVVLEFCGNEIQGLSELLQKGIQVFDVSMPKDGIRPAASSTLKIQFVHMVEGKYHDQRDNVIKYINSN
jgi:hypothetical protein